MLALVFKTVHIIGFVAWFAGLFYLVRMFVYHTDAYDDEQPKRDILRAQYELMESRVYKIICQPAMIITWLCGLAMLYIYGWDWFKENTWIHIKLVPLIMLSGYQGTCKKWMRHLKEAKTKYSSQQFRLINEFPTVMLFIIVPIAVYKNATNPVILISSIVAVIVLLIFFTKLYKRVRERKALQD